MNTPIMLVREKRKEILLILATAVFLALAINFFTFYISAVFFEKSTLLIILCGVSLFVGILLLKRIVFSNTEYIFRFRGAVAYKIGDERIKPVKIIGYSFNRDFCEYLSGFVHENRAYFKIVSNKEESIVSMEQFEPDNLTHHTIINSVVEFTVLHRLELHFNEYFRDNEIDTNRIVGFTRNTLGTDVLRNRVIDQLTKDTKERPAFSRDTAPDTEGTVVYSQGDDGAIFQRLEIELPPNSNIKRNENGHITIGNPLFDITIIPKYEGYATVLDECFLPGQDILFSPDLVLLKMVVHVKNTALFTGKSMEMYEWLDSFIREIQDYFSTDRLMQRVDADLIKMLIYSLRQPADDTPLILKDLDKNSD